MKSKRVFHNPRTDSPWETDGQIRRTCWTYILRKAEVRYRNSYQTRHTYASMMLSAGENILWLAKQMCHKNTKMILEVYAKWIPQPNTESGYKPVNDWSVAVKVA